MQRRLTEYKGHYPWWAYDYRVDLRSFRYQFGTGRRVLLELAVPSERVLFSAYGAWHYVLNSMYLPYSVEEEEHEREGDAWDEEVTKHGISPYAGDSLPEPWHSRMAASWNRIFDVDDLRETNTIQACFERLEMRDVVKVTEFRGVGR